jgi:hypothetical protein
MKFSWKQLSSKQALESARLIVFLGFSFHPRNVDILAPRRIGIVERVIGIRKNISDVAARSIEQKLLTTYFNGPRVNSPIDLANLGCCEFLRQYRAAMAVT